MANEWDERRFQNDGVVVNAPSPAALLPCVELFSEGFVRKLLHGVSAIF